MEKAKHTIHRIDASTTMRIGELSEHIEVETFVIRFWEKEFNLPAQRSAGGQRFYSSGAIERFKLIKDLLYTKGYTIAGAKKFLQEPAHTVQLQAAQKTDLAVQPQQADFFETCRLLKEQLLTLKKLL